MQHVKPTSEIAQWCAEYLSIMLDVPMEKIDRSARFSRLGVDSALLVNLLAGLEELLSTDLDPDVVFEHKTINDLARHLAAQ